MDDVQSEYDELMRKKDDEENFDTEDGDFVKIDPIKSFKVLLDYFFCCFFVLFLLNYFSMFPF